MVGRVAVPRVEGQPLVLPHMCPEMGAVSLTECSTLRPSFPLEKTIREKDLSNQLPGESSEQSPKSQRGQEGWGLSVGTEWFWLGDSGIRAGGLVWGSLRR